MGLYTRGQCVIDADVTSVYLLVLSAGEMIPLHGTFNFPIHNLEHESHDLISILAIQPESFYAKDENEDGIFIYDPRGTVSGYGYANAFIKTSQSEQLNSRGGYLHIFPSGIKFNTLPVDYTRVFLVSFAKLYSIHQPYRQKKDADIESNIVPYHLQNERTTYLPKNDGMLFIVLLMAPVTFAFFLWTEPFFDQNIQFFSSFGTPVFQSKIKNYKSLSVPGVEIDVSTFEILSKCFISYGSRSKSVRKSNRNGWQSTADIFNIYKDTQWIVGDNIAKDKQCKATIGVLYNFLIEQIALWLLSFSNSYYFDDNGLIIDFQTLANQKIYIDIIDSWVNINKGIAMNVPHSHPNSDLSGVVYIDVPHKKNKEMHNFDGDIFFEDPRRNLFDNDMKLQFAQFNEPLQIAPQIGDTILFPSWLRHWTMPTYKGKPRVSFAFNVKFQGVHKGKEQKQPEMDRINEKEKEKVKGTDIEILKKEL